jgi:hypothetical protein
MAIGRISSRSIKRNCRVISGEGLRTEWSLYLKVPQVRRGRIQEANGCELDRRVQAHILEAAEACHKGCSTFPIRLSVRRLCPLIKRTVPDNFWDTGYVEHSACEWSSYRSFRFREGDANICGFQSTAVIGAVATESTAIANALKLLHQFMFLIWRHPSEDLSTNEHLVFINNKFVGAVRRYQPAAEFPEGQSQ